MTEKIVFIPMGEFVVAQDDRNMHTLFVCDSSTGLHFVVGREIDVNIRQTVLAQEAANAGRHNDEKLIMSKMKRDGFWRWLMN